MTPKEFGQRLYRLRMEKGWTQEELAERAEITSRTIQRMESYRILPSVETLAKLVVALCCSWEDLLGPINCPASVIRHRK
jgi:transcriptional regulator with XRE-family HTH domain